jgi:hypothetical protein
MRALAAALAAFLTLVIGLVVGMSLVPQPPPPPQPYIWTDAWSGKQYVVNPAGGVWPRVNDQGRHMLEWEQPR